MPVLPQGRTIARQFGAVSNQNELRRFIKRWASKADKKEIVRSHLMSGRARAFLGDKSFDLILIEQGLLKVEDLRSAKLKSAAQNSSLAQTLLAEGYVNDQQIALAYGEQYGLEFVDLAQVQVDEKAFAAVPERIIKKHQFFPLQLKDDELIVAISDPTEIPDLENLRMTLNFSLSFKIAAASQISYALSQDAGAKKKEAPTAQQSGAKPFLKVVNSESEKFSTETLISQILDDAVKQRASDVHIEPDEEGARVRVRIDGVLKEMSTYSIEQHPQVISRLKVIAGLDIAEKRNAQDGSFHHELDGRRVDLRLSTLPTVRGEKAVMRILDKSGQKLSLNDLDMRPLLLQQIKRNLASPHGLMLVTGPTGSGKTTTVYSMLNEINSLEKNIITVEDPVEFKFKIINQIQVNPRAGLNFATVLRNILRQDPDVIMIGEIRDKETADLAIKAALTGHLVISTIHTNDSLSTVTRLIDMGVEPFLVSSAVTGIVSQRLVRLLCDECKTPRQLEAEHFSSLGVPAPSSAEVTIYEPKGCPSCYSSGYRGRRSIFEFLTPNQQMRKEISANRSLEEIAPLLNSTGFQSMRVDGMLRVLEGVTSLQEVLKATI